MIAGFPHWARVRKYSLGFLALFLFACYDLWLHPSLNSGNEMSLCLMKNIWGIPCPACGTAHGVQQLVKGNVEGAFFSNPLSILVAGIFPWFLFLLIKDLIYGQRIFEQFLANMEMGRKKYPWLMWVSGLLLLVNWLWNFQKWS